MPELPEVETVVRVLQKSFLIGSKVENLEIFTEKIFWKKEEFLLLEQLKNKILEKIERFGKLIIFYLEEFVLLTHLRMTGHFSFKKLVNEKLAALFVFTNQKKLFFYDRRGFAKMYLQLTKDFRFNYPYSSIGPEANKLKVEYFFSLTKKTRKKIKVLLLEQKKISGIGNIYASEILFASKINPFLPAKLLTKEEIEKIVQQSKQILNLAIDKNGSTITDFLTPDEKSGTFQKSLQVYSREKKDCYNCQNPISQTKINSRSTFFCSFCQKTDFLFEKKV